MFLEIRQIGLFGVIAKHNDKDHLMSGQRPVVRLFVCGLVSATKLSEFREILCRSSLSICQGTMSFVKFEPYLST